jgi:hypothetical protein
MLHLDKGFRRHIASSMALGLLLSLTGCGTHSATPITSNTGTTTTGTAGNVAAGPVMGYVWDSAAKGLRPVLGLPGAAYFGAPIFADGSFAAGTACAHKNYAVLTGASGAVFFVSLPSGQPTHLAEALSARQQIAFSPGCSSALVYASDASAVLLLEGLPSTPSAKIVQLSNSAPLAGAAVADSGAMLLAFNQPGGGVSVAGIAADGGLVPAVASLAGFGGLAFLPGSDSALLADAGKNLLWRQSGLSTGAALTQVAAATDGISLPSAVGTSADGRWALILNTGSSSSIVRIDLSKKLKSERVACSCSPSGLLPMSGNLVFRLNELGSGPLWVFDGDMASSRVMFVPEVKRTNPAGAAQ